MDRTVVGKGHCDTSSLLHGASDRHRSLLHTQSKQSDRPSVRTDASRGREVQSIERRCEGSLFVDLSIAATRAKGRKGRKAVVQCAVIVPSSCRKRGLKWLSTPGYHEDARCRPRTYVSTYPYSHFGRSLHLTAHSGICRIMKRPEACRGGKAFQSDLDFPLSRSNKISRDAFIAVDVAKRNGTANVVAIGGRAG